MRAKRRSFSQKRAGSTSQDVKELSAVAGALAPVSTTTTTTTVTTTTTTPKSNTILLRLPSLSTHAVHQFSGYVLTAIVLPHILVSRIVPMLVVWSSRTGASSVSSSSAPPPPLTSWSEVSKASDALVDYGLAVASVRLNGPWFMGYYFVFMAAGWLHLASGFARAWRYFRTKRRSWFVTAPALPASKPAIDDPAKDDPAMDDPAVQGNASVQEKRAQQLRGRTKSSSFASWTSSLWTEARRELVLWSGLVVCALVALRLGEVNIMGFGGDPAPMMIGEDKMRDLLPLFQWFEPAWMVARWPAKYRDMLKS